MGLETASYLSQLQPANPSATDRLQQGDDHIRLLKQVLKNTFPNITGPITLTQAVLNGLPSLTTPTGLITLWYGTAETIPAGWALCDGLTAPRSDGTGTILTPDLRGRVVVGANSSYPYGSTGGTATRTATMSAAGDHSHTGAATAAGEHSHGGSTGATSLSASQLPAHQHAMAANVAVDTDLPGGADQAVAWRTTSSPGESEYSLRAAGGTPATLGRTGAIGSGDGHNHTISNNGQHTHTVSVATAGSHAHTIDTFSIVQPYGALHYIMKT